MRRQAAALACTGWSNDAAKTAVFESVANSMTSYAKSGRMSEAATLAAAGSQARLPERFAGRSRHITADAAQTTISQRPNSLEVGVTV